MAPVRIIVIKKLSTDDIYPDGPPAPLAEDFKTDCPRFKVGDEFVTGDGSCPVGFCGWAFADIQRDITHLRFGGSYPWMKNKKEAIACCTDGLRPVFFRLERIE